MTWQDLLLFAYVWSVPRKELDDCLIEPLLYQSKYKVNIDLSGLEKGNGQNPVQKEKNCQLSGYK